MPDDPERPFDEDLAAGDLKRSFLSPVLLAASGIGVLEGLCLYLSLKLEGGMAFSLTARLIMQKRYGVTIGALSYGGCFARGSIPPGVRIGRFVSIGSNLKVFRRDRFLNWVSLHPIFFNPLFGFAKKDPIVSSPFVIEHDAWIGERVLVTPGCMRIGLGAVVGAGSVVTKDVPDFALVAGNPARLIRFRFPEEVCERIRRSSWWLLPLPELIKRFPEMSQPLNSPDSVVTIPSPTRNRDK
jgi:virginiamycin A acetyltransferase